MIETIKTAILWFLILLSIFLTWNIWTFQPDYDILSVDYIENTMIGEEKTLLEVAKPKQVVIHKGEKFFLVKDSTNILGKIYEQFQITSFEGYTLLNEISSNSPSIEEEGFEIILPVAIPVDLVKEMFSLKESENFLIDDIDRIFLFIDGSTEKKYISARFISSSEGVSIIGKTNMSVSQFEEVFLNIEENDLEVFPYNVAITASSNNQTLYLPEDGIDINSVTYMSEKIEPEHFKQVLFSDPDNVKHYTHPNGEESFTDGSRMVNIINQGDLLRYINPAFIDNSERSSKHIINSSIEFLNGHGGLTDHFYLDQIKTIGTKEEIIYRLNISGYPVLATKGIQTDSLAEIKIIRSDGSQIEQYIRPLFYLDDQQLNIKKTTQLPSGHALVNTLEKIKDFEPYSLKDIEIGFLMVKRQPFIIFEPSWFIYYKNQWLAVDVVEDNPNQEGEVAQNGLE